MYGYGRRKRTEAHEKSMGSYELFAWRDAMSIADLIDEQFGSSRALACYSKVEKTVLIDFEERNKQIIGDFIQKSESQRLPFLNKVAKAADEETRIIFLVLALIGVLRAKAVLELRDRFRTVLVPGRGNRITTAAVYDFSNDMKDLYSYSWPQEVFEDMDFDDTDDQ